MLDQDLQDELEEKTLVGGGVGALELRQGALELQGRVTLHQDHRLAIAIDLSDPLSFVPPEVVTLVFADGTELPVRVDAKLSSVAASAVPGQTLRLVLELGAPLAALPLRIALGEMHGPSGPVHVLVNLDSR